MSPWNQRGCSSACVNVTAGRRGDTAQRRGSFHACRATAAPRRARPPRGPSSRGSACLMRPWASLPVTPRLCASSLDRQPVHQSSIRHERVYGRLVGADSAAGDRGAVDYEHDAAGRQPGAVRADGVCLRRGCAARAFANTVCHMPKRSVRAGSVGVRGACAACVCTWMACNVLRACCTCRPSRRTPRVCCLCSLNCVDRNMRKS
jgi:hypothetical protein